MAREKGVVKWFSTDKGYGFIRRESGDEIFVHHTDIEVDGYASLKNGETVEFDVFDSDRGPKARNLVPLDAGGTRKAPGGKADGRAKSDDRSRKGRSGARNRNRSERSRSAGPTGGEASGKPLAEQLRDRLSRRFPGLFG